MIYRFEGFELDEERFELRRGFELLALPRKSFDLLQLLLRQAGRVVSKEELLAELWPGEHVSDVVLPVHVSTIRKALGEAAANSIIHTVRSRGYSVSCRVEAAQVCRSSAQPQLPAVAFVGRERLMEELQAEFWGAASGQGRALVLYGEAGIGKTRVLNEFANWAQQQNAIVLQAHGEADPGAPPFWTLLELLRSTTRALESEPIRELLEKHGFDPARSETTVRTLFKAPARLGVNSDSARFHLSLTLMQIAQQIAKIAPLVLVIDDLHCVDEDSLRIWRFAVRRLHEHRVLMIAAYRDGDASVENRLSRSIGPLVIESMIREIPLRGLALDAVEALVRTEAGWAPPSALVRALYERTDGNPFFLRELLSLLVTKGTLRPGSANPATTNWNLAELGLPRASRERIERRLGTVSVECNELLAWAAVIGHRFAFPLLERASGLPSAVVLERLREAAEARIIGTEAPSGGSAPLQLGEYCFVHDLFHEAIYTRLTAPERVLRHRTVGEAMEGSGREGTSKELPELARHFFQAAPGGDIDRATHYSVKAARQALRLFAYDNAVLHFESARRAEELRSVPDPLRICCVDLALADALRRAMRNDEALAMFLQAAEGARALGRSDLLAYCALGLAKWWRFVGSKLSFHYNMSHEQRSVLHLVEDALAELGHSGDERSGRLRARLQAAATQTQDLISTRITRSMKTRLIASHCEPCGERASSSPPFDSRWPTNAAFRSSSSFPQTERNSTARRPSGRNERPHCGNLRGRSSLARCPTPRDVPDGQPRKHFRQAGPTT